MNFSRLSIRTTLLAIISVLNVLIAVLTGSGVYRSWSSLKEIQELEHQSSTINLLYIAEKYLSIERGLSMAVMNTPPDIAEPIYKELLKDRQNADSYLEAALDRIFPANNETLAAAVSQVKSGQQYLKEIRLKLDQASLPSALPQDKYIYDQTFDTITAAVTNVESLIKILSSSLLNTNTTVSQQIYFKHFIWELTEYAGREYALIGRLIVENQAPAKEIQNKLALWKGRTEHDWEISLQFARSSGLAEKIEPHMEEAKTHYDLTFDQIKDMFYGTGPQLIKPPYPIGIELWLEMSTQAVDSLISLKDMALLETQNYIEGLEKSALHNIIINLLMFVCALALSFYSSWVIIQRVIKPVDTMANSLYKQAYGLSPQITSEQDEIGKLSLALEVFQENKRRIEQTSKDLEQQKNYLKTVLSTILDAIITINSQGIIQMVNPAVERMFGYSENELIGQNVKILMPSQYAVGHDHYVGRYLKTHEAKIIGKGREVEAKRKDGSIFPVELAITEMKGTGNHMFVGMLRDITERKVAEAEKNRYMQSLENSNRELDDFAYIASHDLKEPLRGLHNFSRFLLEDYEDKLEDEGKNMLHTIANLTKRMDSLLSSLLHYSRLGRTELSVRKTDLNETVHNAIAMYDVQIKESGTDIKIIKKLPEIVCDHVRITEVFQNLIGNALKYSEAPARKIEIGYRTDHPEHPGKIAYFVRDNGIGIDKKNLDSIFKIFRRLHAQDAYGGGTGSGLTIAKRIITRHGGQIWAESSGKDLGTTFFFTIPTEERPKTEHSM